MVSPESFLLLVVLILPLVYLQRFLQKEIQSIFLLITHHPEVSTALFSLLFLPGVMLHELSHFLMAHLLGVRTGRFSIIPKKLEGGRLQLGYVETASTDFVRDAIIGVAPLLAGGVFIAFAGASRLQLDQLWLTISQGQPGVIFGAFDTTLHQPDFWLWFYLIFTVSSTMMPSASDRRAWLPVILAIGLLGGIILILGIGPWLLSRLGSILKSAVDAITIVFGTTVFIHVLLLLPAWAIRKIISRFSGYQVV